MQAVGGEQRHRHVYLDQQQLTQMNADQRWEKRGLNVTWSLTVSHPPLSHSFTDAVKRTLCQEGFCAAEKSFRCVFSTKEKD